MNPDDISNIPDRNDSPRPAKSRKGRILRNILFSLIGIWAIVLVVLQIVLSSAFLTRTANRFAHDFIDGDVSFGKVSMSIFRNFPNLNVAFQDVSVTYPSERFAGQEGAGNFYSNQGRGETCDTLLSFKEFSASVNIAALTAGQVRISSLSLVNPRIFAKQFSGGDVNWNIVKSPDKSSADSTGSQFPRIFLGKVRFSGKPHIVYSSYKDTVFADIRLKEMLFNGRLSTGNMGRSRIGFEIDSMFIAGRLPSDTLALKLDRLNINQRRDHINIRTAATTYLATKSAGRMKLPIDIRTEIHFPKDSAFALSVRNFKAAIAGIPITADAYVRIHKDSLYVKGNAGINGCKANDALKYFGKNLWKELDKLQTDAVISMEAGFDGWYDFDGGRIPQIEARLMIPEASIKHSGFRIDNKVSLDAGIYGSDDRHIRLAVNRFMLEGKGIGIDAGITADDILGEDPEFDFNGKVSIELDTLRRKLKSAAGITANGMIKAELDGKIRKSQIDPYRFADADLKGFFTCDRVVFSSPRDSIDFYADSLDIRLGSIGNTRDSSIAQGERMLAIVAAIDSTSIVYKSALQLRGRNLSLKAQNSAAILDKSDSSKFYPFGGLMEIGFLSLRDADTSIVAVMNSSNTFTVSPSSGNYEVPVLSLKSKSGGLFLKGPVNRLSIRELDMTARAEMNSIERKKRAKAFIDSLTRKYPEVPRDSLFSFLRGKASSRPMPEWLTEKDFQKKDLDLSVNATIAKYIREWDLEGSLAFRSAGILTPYLPLRNRVENMEGSFNNREINLEHIKIKSGSSNISVTGKLTGLRRALLGNGLIGLEVDVKSDRLNLNELLSAYAAGKDFEYSELASQAESLDDTQYQEMIVTDTLANVTEVQDAGLIVIPANINARISLQADSVSYSRLEIDSMTSELTVKERCVQFTNLIARSNVGNIYFEGFYSTRTKSDLKTGFDLSLKDVTAEKVIEMMPAVDSLLPMLKSFKGHLNCDFAATADLDTAMNIKMPSVNGIMRIQGSGLSLDDNKAFSEIADILKFKNRETGRIDNMSVEGLIADNRIEIFPFVLKIDRYTLAMSGVQNMDTSFKYHISVLESPLVFRLGIDISGNFENYRFKIGKAKYKSTNVPVFSSVVDKTRLNLRESIQNVFDKGIEEAMKGNERQKFIDGYKSRINYTQAVDENLDTLTAEEEAELERTSEVRE